MGEVILTCMAVALRLSPAESGGFVRSLMLNLRSLKC